MEEGLVNMNGNETAVAALPSPQASVELTAIAAAYEEVSRRDTSLEKRLYHAHVREVVLIVLLMLLGGILAWVFATRSQVQAFVQVVQVDDDKRVHLLGAPQDLQLYAARRPVDGHAGGVGAQGALARQRCRAGAAGMALGLHAQLQGVARFAAASGRH